MWSWGISSQPTSASYLLRLEIPQLLSNLSHFPALSLHGLQAAEYATSPASVSSGSPLHPPHSLHHSISDTRLSAVCSQITFLSSRLNDFSTWMLPTSEMQCAQILFLPYFLLLVFLTSLMVPPTTNRDNNNKNHKQNQPNKQKLVAIFSCLPQPHF